MPDPQISTRIPLAVLDEIKVLTDSKKYRSMTEFINHAVLEKLERERTPDTAKLKQDLVHLFKSDPNFVHNEILSDIRLELEVIRAELYDIKRYRENWPPHTKRIIQEILLTDPDIEDLLRKRLAKPPTDKS